MNTKRKTIVILLAIFFMSVIARVLLAGSYYEVYTFYDELLHGKMAASLARLGHFEFRGISNWKNDYVYYILLSPAFYFFEGTMCKYAVYVINACLMSSVVFPLYALSSYFCEKESNRWIVCLLRLLMPEMSYTGSVLQENVFYPLVILYVTVFCACERKRENYKLIFLFGILAGFLYNTKDTGVICVIATVCTWILNVLLDRFQNMKDKVKQAFVFLAGFSITEGLLRFLLEHVFYLTDSKVSVMSQAIGEATGGTSTLLDSLCLGMLRQSGSYLVFFVIVTGFFPFFMVLAALPKMETYRRSVFLFSYIALLGIILATCILEYHPADTLEIRMHYRYLFWILPILIIGFLYVTERKELNRWLYLLSGLFVTGIHFVCSSIAKGHLFDAISAKPFSIVRIPEIYLLFKLALSVLIIVTFLMISKRQELLYKFMKIVVVVVLILTDIHSNRLQYRDVNAIHKETSVDSVADANLLNELILDEELCIVVAERDVSMATFEYYFDKEYVYTLESKYIEDEQKDSYRICQVSKWYQINKNRIRYIISENELNDDNVEEIEVGLRKYHVYTRK